MTRTSQWLLFAFLAAATCGLVLALWILQPRDAQPLVAGEETSFRYTFDPHLFLTAEDVSVSRSDTGTEAVSLVIRASNTAVGGDLTFDLSELRFAVETVQGDLLDPVPAEWHLDGAPLPDSALPPDATAEATIRLLLPADVEPAAVVIWEETPLVRHFPFARGSFLDPRLRTSLDGD